MAHLPMSEVVFKNEFGLPRIFDQNHTANAKEFLVSQMYTDAVFNSDIRMIQTIINRVDGGLPKDTEVEEYQTLFGDCMREVLDLTDSIQLKVLPDDTVMMALCKSLYDIATTDIYHEYKNGQARKINPSTERKQARDSASRLILERAGGRKTATPSAPKTFDKVDVADWVKNALGGVESDVAAEPESE